MIMVIGSVLVNPARRADALELSLAHVKRSREESGCIDHRVSIDAENDLRLVFVEHWADMPALMAHFDLATSQDFVKSLTAMVTAAPVMNVFNVDEIQI